MGSPDELGKSIKVIIWYDRVVTRYDLVWWIDRRLLDAGVVGSCLVFGIVLKVVATD